MSSSEEVAAAAERLARLEHGEESLRKVYEPIASQFSPKYQTLCDRSKDEWCGIAASSDQEELASAYLAELSTDPITPQLLEADGWERTDKETEWKHGYSHIARVTHIWFFRCLSNHIQGNSVRNMGEVRTMRRLAEPQTYAPRKEGE